MTAPMPTPCRCPIRRRAGMCERPSPMPAPPLPTGIPSACLLAEEGA